MNDENNILNDILNDNMNEIISDDYIACFVKKLAKSDFKYIDDEKIHDRPAYYNTSLLAMVIYSFYDNLISYQMMEYLSKNSFIFRYLGNELEVNGITFQRFVENNNELFKKVLKRIIEIVKDKGFTEFNQVYIEGTIIKEDENSNVNIIKSKEIDKLIKIIRKQFDEETIIKKGYKLSKTGYVFLMNNKLTDDEKVEILQELRKELKKSGQNNICLTNTEEKWILNEEKNPRLISNMYSTVDYTSKMIVSVNITNQDNSIEDVEDNNEVSTSTMDDMDLITSDTFIYNFDTDSYTCPMEEELYLQESCKVESTKKGQVNKIKKVYYPVDCGNCELKEKCGQSKIRFITDYESSLLKIVNNEIEISENDVYRRVESIKPPFGRRIKKKELTEINVRKDVYLENIIILRAIGYNLKVLENMMYNNIERELSLRKFMNELIQEYSNMNFSTTIN